MKLITAIVNKEDSKNVCNELLKSKFYVTRLATTGGFLMAGNVTFSSAWTRRRCRPSSTSSGSIPQPQANDPTTTEMSYGYYPPCPWRSWWAAHHLRGGYRAV
mgnify:CR=1 FL=1